MTTRAEQKQQRYQDILETALDQFIRKGYAETRIKDIAAAAGMSVGLLFHYFESKEALYIELIKLGISAPRTMADSLAQVAPLEFFEMAAQYTLKYAAESPFTAKMFVLMGHAYYNEGIPEAAQELAHTTNFYQEMIPFIQAGQVQGTIRQGNPLALSTTFWTALQGAIEAYALNPELSLPEPEWLVDIIREKEQA